MSAPRFYTSRGRLTRYALACGYVDTTHGDGTRIESRGPAILVRADDGHAILYNGPRLSAAREAARDYVRTRYALARSGHSFESVGIGSDYVARVRSAAGVIVGTGPTLWDAMKAARGQA